MIMMMMMKMSLGLLLLGFVVTSAAAGPGSCVGRCGEVFTRGQQCTCDFSCLQHNECCQDFEATCTIAQSCQGRCGQTFRRGQLCECDPMCVTYNTCCHDYQRHCDASVFVSHQRTFQSPRATASKNRKSGKSKKRSNSESEEWYRGMNNIPVGLLPMPVPPSHSGAPWSSAPGSSYLPSNIAPSPGGGGAPVSPSTAGGTGSQVNVQLVVSPGGVHPSKPNQGQTGAADSRPSTLQDVAQALGLSLAEGGPGGPGTGNFDADLCSDSPINGLTALPNGTILIFKGELFWSVDPVTRSVGQPQSITDTLGVPSPIDTVFTRSNCHGHTYIIKGDQYWRLDENLAMEPGFPKPLASEFPGLTGSITAALAVAATRSKPETVYFFKSGDVLQKFTFPSGSTPPCGKKPGSPLNRRFARQAEVLLSGEINIKVSLKGFPTPITSALSMPSPQGSDRYNHYVFSGPLFFSVQITGDLPELAKPDPSAALAPLPILSPAAAASNTAASNTAATNAANMAALSAKPPHPANSIRVWLNCP